jgi:abortive infection bacteriophage resistance protein
MEFNKPPLSFDDQIALLRELAMLIADEPLARQHLAHIN